MSRYVLNVPLPSPKFQRRHCSTGLERNSCMKFFPMLPPRTKILAPPLYTVYIVRVLYIYVVTCAPTSAPTFIRGGPHGIHAFQGIVLYYSCILTRIIYSYMLLRVVYLQYAFTYAITLYNRVVQTVGPGPKFGPLTDFCWALQV